MWKSESVRPTLLNNERLAMSRLDQSSRSLARKPELEARYHGVFCEMQKEGVIEEVPSDEVTSANPIFYMPHRPVLKESSLNTKVRPVFDASAKGFNGVSLNDCTNTGPSLIPNLPGILMRFRRWKVALSADVTKAFHQIQVRREDQDVHRFLWVDQGVVRRMRFVRLPFGNKSSAFLLNATVQHHLSQFPPSRVIEELSENMYVDDWLSGCDDDSDGCDMLRAANEIMSHAGMSLAKWGSNSEQVGDVLHKEFQDKLVGEESHKVLSMRWMVSQDCFTFDGVVVPDNLCVTKRVVLSFMSRLFDPLGFLVPFVMTAKCLFQELWRLGVAWDEVVSVDIQERFAMWIKGLDCLKSWLIPRSYLGIPWRDVVVFQLHAFGDASQSAYGACVYLHVQLIDCSWLFSLVIARAKVAPLKRVSLPRMELLGALLAARLVVFTRQPLKLPDDVTCHCWTYSKVTLAWMQSDPHKWKPFVGNRVAEIHTLISPSQWQFCPGKHNPADLVTRGMHASELVNSELWINGPAFLLDHSGQASNNTVNGESNENVVQESFIIRGESRRSMDVDRILLSVDKDKKSDSAAHASELGLSDVLLIDRWSTFTKGMRVMGWVLRFVHNSKVSKNERKQGDLSFAELTTAKISLLQVVQRREFGEEWQSLQNDQPVSRKSPIHKLSPFIGEDGLLRVQGRLQFSGLSYEVKHPIIIPKGHMGVLLARQVHSRMKHAGVNSMLVELRNQYWVVGARRICKKVKKECVSCQRVDRPAGSQTMAPLPAMRVTQAPPFSVSGLDHGGPLYCCDFVGKKFYILLFTCAVTRAIHLELVESLSCEATLLALRRF